MCLRVHNICIMIIFWSHLFPTSPSYSSQIHPLFSFSKMLWVQLCWPGLLTIHWDVFDPPEVIPCLFSSKNPPTFSSSRGMGAPNSSLLWNVGWHIVCRYHGCHELCMQQPCYVQKTSLHLGLPKPLALTTLPCPPQGPWAFEGVREMLHLCLNSLLGLILCPWFCCEAVC